MSLAEALDIAAHPTRWIQYFTCRESSSAARGHTSGLISQLTLEQRARIFEYDGPLASGSTEFPRVKNESRKAA